MKIMINLKKINRSIKLINYILFIFMIWINCFFYISDVMREFELLYFTINWVIILIFFIFNMKYENETFSWRKDIKKLSLDTLNWNDPEIKDILFKKNKYKENEDTYKLFKNMYIKKNLLAKDYEDLKSVFLKFIPETFLKEVGKMGTDKISLGLSVKKHLNVMFLDIIWFSSITEKLSPDKALLLLNMYFDWIVEIIKSNWWYIDKFLWDWIMVIFDSDSSDSAIKSSIEIQLFINKFQVSDIWKKISVWIWINSWEVILWTIGSRNRMEITIIWDVVNTASRIEGLTRWNKNNILISDSTFKIIKNKKSFNITDLWIKTLRWKSRKIKIHWIESVLNIDL